MTFSIISSVSYPNANLYSHNNGLNRGITFKANPMQDNPQTKKDFSNGQKAAICLGLAAALAIGCDFLFCKGKHIKQLVGKDRKIFKSKIKPDVKPDVKPEVTPKVKPDVKPEAIKEAKLKAEKDLEKLSSEISNISRADLAKQRHELNRWGSEIGELEKKASKDGLTELENVRLDFLKRKQALLEERELQISKSLKQYVPTVSENSAVSMHHKINGINSKIRSAIENRTMKNLSKEQIIENQRIEKYIAKIDKEFDQLPPLEKECIVYRGRAEHPVIKRFNTDFKIMGNAKIGDVVIPDKAYSYTAFDYDMANNWCSNRQMTDLDGKSLRSIMYEIHLPKGARVSRNLEHRGEVVMPRGAEYIIKDKKVDSEGCMNIILEYILPKAK